jgi:hypothetical protein
MLFVFVRVPQRAAHAHEGEALLLYSIIWYAMCENWFILYNKKQRLFMKVRILNSNVSCSHQMI